MKSKTTRQLITACSATAALLSLTVPAHAALVTNAGALGGPATVIDFSDKAQQFTLSAQVGALVGKDVQFTGSGPSGGFSFNGYGLGSNGTWGSGMTYAFIDNGLGAWVNFKFNDGPVSGVGGFVNYCVFTNSIGCGSGPFFIEALDAANAVIESYDISTLAPISTPNALNGGAFRGISRANADIYSFRLTGGVAVIDDLTFVQPNTTVPEPATLALVGLALAGLGVSRRRPSA